MADTSHALHRILVTLGPASFDQRVVQRLDALGVDIFRINLSHTPVETLDALIGRLQSYTHKPICIDTEGAQIRNRYVENNCIILEEGSVVELTGEPLMGTPQCLSLNPGFVVRAIPVGSLISIDFHAVMLQVLERCGERLRARVVAGGPVGSNKAITIDQPIPLPVLSEKDVAAIQIARKRGLQHFALSFASSKDAVLEVRALVGDEATIISKIESREGIHHLEDIITASDAILIDRGDLSREVALEKIPFMQKLIIQAANRRKVPVYVATNLLESMVHQKKPTRAEANDVVNTLLDGADGLVLAAETAIGQHPIDCVAMIASMIDHFSANRAAPSLSGLLEDTSRYLVMPHGGRLINTCVAASSHIDTAAYPELIVPHTALMDAEQIAIGTYSPLQGFMTKSELTSVLRDHALPSGVVWPLPVLLQLPQAITAGLREGTTYRLTDRRDGTAYALLTVEEIYSYDLQYLVREMFRTTDVAHPGVAGVLAGEPWFVGGRVQLLQRLASPLKSYELTPRQARMLFETKGWSRVVGFHTRNVSHRAHEMLQLNALERYGCDGLFIHPVVGPKKRDDYLADVIVRSYERMVQQHYPRGKVVLGAFSSYSRYAGPREAVFTALCRKNFGCSHFIMGRDHTGVGNYYHPTASQTLFRELGDIGVTPVFFDPVHYCRRCERHVEQCGHEAVDHLAISGSEARRLFQQGECPPDWFMRPDIAQLLLDDIHAGKDIFVR